MANKKKRSPRFPASTQPPDRERTEAPGDDEPAAILYQPPDDAAPSAPATEAELLYVPEPEV
ncbi:MAG: hypothetical protein QOE63_1592, partial [Acidimicrobiaceae bacterium]